MWHISANLFIALKDLAHNYGYCVLDKPIFYLLSHLICDSLFVWAFPHWLSTGKSTGEGHSSFGQFFICHGQFWPLREATPDFVLMCNSDFN